MSAPRLHTLGEVPAAAEGKRLLASDQELPVGIGGLVVATGGCGALVTYSLGSCLGVSLFDPKTRVGGMIHFRLAKPDTPDTPVPADYATTGVPHLFRSAFELGAERSRLVVCVAGGAEMFGEGGQFRIGRKNHATLRKLLWKNQITVAAEEVGGSQPRTMRLDLRSGEVRVRNATAQETLWSRNTP